MHLQFKSVQGVHDTKIVQTLFPQLPNGLDESLFLCSLETLAHILPVDDVPDGLHVVRPDVFVLQVVGVLPDVDAQEWDEAWGVRVRKE